MELLAFTQAAVAFEDSTPIQVRQWSQGRILPIGMSLPSSAWVNLLSIAVFAATVGAASTAQAALCKSGDRGLAVKEIQDALQTGGYYQGSIDGIYGTQTEQAVRIFQREKALAIDGKVGNRTLAALSLGDQGIFGNSRCNAGDASTRTRSYRVSSVSGLNVRSSPAGDVIGGLEPDAVVTLADETQQAGSYQWGRLADRTGWVALHYLAPIESQRASRSTSAAPADRSYRVSTPRGLRIRAEAALSAPIVGSLMGGNAVSLTAEERVSGGYTWGKLAGRSGWVAKEFLVPVEAASTPAPAEASPATPPQDQAQVTTTDDVTPAATPPVVSGEAGAIVDETDFGTGQIAKTSATKLAVRSQPSLSSDLLVTLDRDTFVAVTKQVKLNNGESWYLLPAYNGWVDGKALTLIE